MARRDLIVIGGSAGAHAALQKLLARLPVDLPAAVLIVTHLAPGARSALADVLAKQSVLPVAAAADGETARPGRVYVAVPDHHLVLGAGDVLRLSAGPRQNRVRPAVDALFRAAARWGGARVAGVVLSGSLDDGAAGLAAVVQQGGAALVQDPEEARFPGMPRAALAAVPSAVVAPAGQLGKLLTELAGRPVGAGGPPDEDLIWETDMAAEGRTAVGLPQRPVALGCPDCRGGMYEVRTGRAVHYVCHVGHSWSPESFVVASDDGIEQALWTAVSAMQEKVTMLGELAVGAERAGDRDRCEGYRTEADRVRRDAALVQHRMLGAGQPAPESQRPPGVSGVRPHPGPRCAGPGAGAPVP
ncbi:chemotaxis protein CheB [Actinoplanes teichomyceticus]|uniref:protein-glutamate methylesterase n=1 Tax=Actinoplanes teichomyceticus TaxID=1867 RepID=A0A561WBD1_ACTTI|nr:chemotaxis protein CheB [Actinoplanes teichomyceticus]TWG21174.1 two-component system chemotaxis response regulator CheB [Actinoplanes teichomyceticus]GIF14995.1 chemotaxis protein CheB [Actinoplanes teichomyceticus]